jgi:N-acetylated-alpha-linked acidic dipeptidase
MGSRIESEAADLDISLDFKSLRKTISRLERTSRRLDKRKDDAEKRLLRLLEKWRHMHDEEASSEHAHKRAHRNFRFGKATANLHARSETHSHRPHHGDRDRLLRKIIKAGKRVQRINRKLATFESGFISSEGIKDREWYVWLLLQLPFLM